MSRLVKYFLCAMLLSATVPTWSQCPTVSFTIPAGGCINGNVQITNSSTIGNTYAWDFCGGDLATAPAPTTIFASGFLARSRSFKIIEDSGNWYGFAIDQVNNVLLRFNFGSSLTNTPTMVNLGSMGNQLQNAFDFFIHQEGSQWYALVANTASSNILKLQFGTNITSVPAVINLGNFGGVISLPNGIFGVTEMGLLSVFVTIGSSAQIVRLDFGSSINNTPTPILFPMAIGSGLQGISLIKECNRWFGLVTSYGNAKLLYLDFINGIDQTPVSGEFASGLAFPATVTTALEGGTYYAFIQSAFPGNVYRVDFGSSIIDRTGALTDLGNISGTGGSADNFAFTLAHQNSDWFGFFVDNSGSRLMRIPFASPCNVTTSVSSSYSPVVSYTQAGTFKIAQTVTDADGNISSQAQSIAISSLVAPDIDFASQNSCANHDVNFISQNISGDITDYDWDFGDANTSMAQNPTHQYAMATDYEVSLQVTATNGCNNLARESITIYNEPIANFDLPNTSPGPVCTNQEYLFSNTSIFDVDSNPTWQWEVNGSPVGFSQDLTYTIPTATGQSVKLIASIPGCESEITQVINIVEEGPVPDFTFVNDCEDTAILFTDATSGTTSGLSWDFGDGNTSMQTNPSNTFVDFGNYDVTLTASNLAGCMNTISKPIQIYSKPIPDFSLDLPPFSCAGSLSQFNDLTPNPTDSNLSGWTWSFGDAQNGTSMARNPQYVYDVADQYNVHLEVKTNFNCTASVQKIVTILPSPSADFSFSTACVNQGTTFTPTTTANVSSWQWSIGGSMYAQQSPTHVFSTSSTFNAQLTANGSNGCITVLTKPVPVPVPTNVNFTVENNCTDQNAIFTSTSIAGPDPIVSSVWQFGSLGSGTGANASFVFPSPGVYPTQLTVTNLSGCMFTTTKDVNVVNPPVATFEATPLAGGPPLVLNLINTSSNVASQVWSVDGKTSTGAFATFTLNDLGQYEAELSIVSPEGCTDKASTIVSVVVPALDIELTNLELMSAAAGENNILITLVNHGNVPVNNPDVLIMISEQTPIHETINTVIQPGQTFTQAFTAGTGNINYLCVEVGADGDIDNTNNRQCLNQESGTVVLDPYPNPVADNLNLDWIAIETERVEISIFDPTGRKVFENTFDNLNEGLNHVSISLTELHPGMYYLFFVSGSARKSFPFVLRR